MPNRSLPPHYKNSNAGFTLLELLVVIAIIGVLASIVLASLTEAREKARDATRLTMLREMRNALELYHSDVGSYPDARDSGGSIEPPSSSPYAGELGPTVANTPGLLQYYTEPPVDPLDPNAVFLYKLSSQGYAIAVVLESLGVYCQYRVNAPVDIFDDPLGAGTPECLE